MKSTRNSPDRLLRFARHLVWRDHRSRLRIWVLALAVVTVGQTDALGKKPGVVSGPVLGDPGTGHAKHAQPVGQRASETAKTNEHAQPTKNMRTAQKPGTREELDSPQKPEATRKPETSNNSEATDRPGTGDKARVVEKPKSVGEPLAAGMIELLQQEIVAGLRGRNIQANFSRFQSYAAGRLDATARHSGSEVTGKCRLKWYDHLLRNPLKAPAEAEAFTRSLHEAVLDNHEGLARVLAIAAERLDLNRPKPQAAEGGRSAEVTSPEQALEVIKRALSDAQLAYAAALAPLGRNEIDELTKNLYPIMTDQNRVGHTLQQRGTGRRLCDLMDKLDRDAMHAAAEALLPIASPELLEQLKSLDKRGATDGRGSLDGDLTVDGADGPMVRRINTPAGAILIGGKQKNTYRLDQMPGVSVVIDLGGNDVYHEGTVSPQRPVLIVIDLAGNDGYRGSRPGVQGAAVMGISMLLELAGDDVYYAKDVGQGSSLVGAGILIDYDGNDAYVGVRRVQGEAIGGLGILIDRAGNDRYHAAMWAQGFGGPRGFGMLDDIDGEDHYYGGGLYLNSYLDDENPTPGYEGWAQGVGAGLRQVCDGGIGVILDGGGDDTYEYDYLSHGGGYWCGTGFARDFGGNDRRLGATRVAYDGKARTQRRFQRFGSGYGCHYALGFLFDDRGDDTYDGTIMCVGFAWDCSVGYLCDFGGSDSYGGTQGNGAQAGLGVIFDYDGADVYNGSKQGRAASGISYHSLPACGGNFGFVIDHGGTDKYGCGAKNNSYNRRASSGGFLIDRPKPGEIQKTAEKTTKKTSKKTARKATARATGKR